MRTQKTILAGLAALLLTGGAALASDSDCLDCHGESPFIKAGRNLYVSASDLAGSVHGQAGLGCTDCHDDLKPADHPAKLFAPVKCASCHEKMAAVKSYLATPHGMSKANQAAKCQDCHTAHAVRKPSDPLSPANPCNIERTCAGCHREEASPGLLGDFLSVWRVKGHGKGDLNGRYSRSACLSCHPGSAHAGAKTDEAKCPDCHKPGLGIFAGVKNDFHLRGDSLTSNFYSLLVWGGGVLVGLAFLALPAFRKKKD